MNSEELQKKSTVAAFWNISGALINQVVSFAISLFLARILSPSDFGLVGMAMVFITISQSFSDFGMTSGLIQKKEPSELEYSTVFWINIVLSFLLMLIMMASAKLIANFYNTEEITPIIRVVSIMFLINALNNVQVAQLTKILANRVKVIANLSSAIVTGVSGIAMALMNWGVWSLIYSSILGRVFYTSIIWFFSSWRPKFIFNFSEVRPLLGFGSKMFASGIVDTIYNKLDVIIIGKIFSATTLGFYYRALSLNQLIIKYSTVGTQGIFFPVFSHLQHNKEEQVKVAQKSLHLISFLTFLLCGLMYITAGETISILFTQKWAMSIKYFELMVFSAYGLPISVILVNILSGNGHSGMFLKLEVWKKSIGLLAMVVGFLGGIERFLVFSAAATLIALLLNMWYVSKILPMSIREQLSTIWKYAIVAFLGSLVILLILPISDMVGLMLFLKTILFLFIYLSVNILIKTNGWLSFYSLLNNKVLNKLKK